MYMMSRPIIHFLLSLEPPCILFTSSFWSIPLRQYCPVSMTVILSMHSFSLQKRRAFIKPFMYSMSRDVGTVMHFNNLNVHLMHWTYFLHNMLHVYSMHSEHALLSMHSISLGALYSMFSVDPTCTLCKPCLLHMHNCTCPSPWRNKSCCSHTCRECFEWWRYTVRKVLADFAVCDLWRYCKALLWRLF